jgi:lipopolysaccharide transport system permease protein
MSKPYQNITATKRLEPSVGWRLIDWRELFAYRDLFWFLVWRDVKVRYKQSVLGFGWALVRPFFSMVVFTIIFGNLASMPSDGVPYPLFSFAALLPWTYFSTSMSSSTSSLVSSAGMLSKVYFPRLIIPCAPVLGNLVDLFIGLALLGLLMLYFGVMPGLSLAFLPILILLMIITSLGVGLWLSALAVQFRDVNQAMTFVVQLGMYAAPVVWPISLITKKFPEHGDLLVNLYAAYPMVGVIEGFRSCLLGATPVAWNLIGIGYLIGLALLISGAFYFRRMERNFADVV